MLLDCQVCKARVSVTQQAAYDDEVPWDEDRRWILCTCDQCVTVMLAVVPGQQPTDGTVKPYYPEYRARRAFPAPPRTRPGVPNSIDASMREAHVCRDAGAYTACVIMCRRVLESMTRDLLPNNKGSLEAKIDLLHKGGMIDKRLHGWATALREDGNLAAHEPDSTFDGPHCQDVLDFSEALIDQVYILARRFEEFEKRRAERKAASKLAAKKLLESAKAAAEAPAAPANGESA